MLKPTDQPSNLYPLPYHIKDPYSPADIILGGRENSQEPGDNLFATCQLTRVSPARRNPRFLGLRNPERKR